MTISISISNNNTYDDDNDGVGGGGISVLTYPSCRENQNSHFMFSKFFFAKIMP